MKRWFSLSRMCAAAIGLMILPAPVLARQKTVKTCQDEWRANRADNQAKGITEKAYVTQCRAPATTPAAAPSANPSAASPAPVKTVKACQDEWKANKAAYQTAKITERAYVDKCRTGEPLVLPNTPAAAPSANPTAAAPTPTPTPTPAPSSGPVVRPSPTVGAAPAGADEFQTEAQAKSHCPTDLVVWVNITSKIYHFAGHKSYGTTKSGAYMCEKEATGHGFRASKTEKRPSA